MVSKPTLIWDKSAYDALLVAYNYIKEDSISNAIHVLDEILKITRSLPDHPQKYPADKFKSNNSGNYRSFEKNSYRVTYKITKTEIIILRIRHVKQEPKEF